MSVEVVPGGHRRIDRVLDPRFTDGVERLDLAELRARREEAEAEEADVSYLRRLLQGRLDILRAELERRSAGGDQDVAGLLAGLPAILTDDAPGTFSAVPRIQLRSRSGGARRRRSRPTGGPSSGWSTCSAASWPAATGTAPPRCRSSSSDLLDPLEGFKPGRLRSDGYRAGPTAPPCPERG